MKKILVAVDGSSVQDLVLAAAVEYAQRFDASVQLVRAVSLPLGLPADAFTIRPDALESELVQSAKMQLNVLASTIKGVAVEPVIAMVGSPWRTICDLAKTNQCDLIVVGSHGFGGIDHLLGTTSAKVVNHAPCSVLVIRDRA